MIVHIKTNSKAKENIDAPLAQGSGCALPARPSRGRRRATSEGERPLGRDSVRGGRSPTLVGGSCNTHPHFYINIQQS